MRVRRQSMEQLDLIKITPDGKRMQEEKLRAQATRKAKDDDFFEMLSRSQSKRMDDQRCSIKVNPAGAPAVATGATRKPLVQQNSLFVDPTNLPGLKSPSSAIPSAIGHGPLARSATTTQQPDDDFLDMLMRCQGSRLEEQRSELPRPNVTMDAEAEAPPRSVPEAAVPGAPRGQTGRGATVPDEDFFSLIMKVQSGRMEDQRASIPFRNANNNNNSRSNNNGSAGGAGK